MLRGHADACFTFSRLGSDFYMCITYQFSYDSLVPRILLLCGCAEIWHISPLFGQHKCIVEENISKHIYATMHGQ